MDSTHVPNSVKEVKSKEKSAPENENLNNVSNLEDEEDKGVPEKLLFIFHIL